MKNFFEQQDRAKLVTNYLIFLFVCAIAFTTVIFYIALIFAETMATERFVSLWRPEHFMWSGIAVIVGVGFGSFQKSQSLRGGGPVVAASLGGVAVVPETDNPQQRELLNIVAEMAIAAGVPHPKVYVLPDRGINAFAAGHTHRDAVVAVTQGTLDRLTRDEIQGVVGHEFSHILNGDMALNLRLIGVVHGLLVMHLAGREILYRTRFSGRKKDGAWVLGIGMGLMVSGGVGWIFGQLIKSAVSRQREFLADAAAVQFTRNPEGLASALTKIAATTGCRSLVSSPKAAEASHLFFCPPIKAGFFSAMATHPPLDERIRRLGGPVTERMTERSPATANATPVPSAQLHSGGAISSLAGNPSPMQNIAVAPLAATTHSRSSPAINTPQEAIPTDLVHAKELLNQLPKLLLKAAKLPIGAVAVVYGLLLSNNTEIRTQQKQLIANHSAGILKAVEKIEPSLVEVERRSRLPLMELCVPALSALKPETATQLFKCVQALIQVNGKRSLSAYAFKTVLYYRLAPHFQTNPPAKPTIPNISAVASECQLLLSALAKTGHKRASDADYALRCGHAQFAKQDRAAIATELVNGSLTELDRALKILQAVTPEVKRAIAAACTHTVLANGKTTDAEAELLRAILVTLSCPLPPFIDKVNTTSTHASAKSVASHRAA